MQSFICVLAFKSDLFDYIVILLQIHQMKKKTLQRHLVFVDQMVE